MSARSIKARTPRQPAPRGEEKCILVLQGGGAPGAYQAGGLTPEWVAGISIGAINAALIAGNPPERRVARLREFWDRVSASPVDLFAARGEMPATLADVGEREKDIRYSSRTRLNTTYELKRQAMLQSARRLLAKLPASLRDDPDAQLLAELPVEAPVTVVHLIYRSKPYESQSKDYEFSRASMLEHWAGGLADTTQTLADPRWKKRRALKGGVEVFDLLNERPVAAAVTPAQLPGTRHP